MNKLLRGAFWVACATVAVLSLLPRERLPPVFVWWDKAQHILAFFTLGVLGLSAYSSIPSRITLGLFLFGLAIEFIQAASGWRYGDWQDWLADTIGLVLAYFSWVFLSPLSLGMHSKFIGFLAIMKSPRKLNQKARIN